MTEQRPPVDFDAQKAADRIADLIAEGSVLARGWAERFARRREDAAPADPGATDQAHTDPVAPDRAPMSPGDPWSEACDDATAADLPAAGGKGSPPSPAGEATVGTATARGVDPSTAAGVPTRAADVDALMAALRATAAQRLGVPVGRIRVTVVLDDREAVVLDDRGPTTGSGGASSGAADPASAGAAMHGIVVQPSKASGERDPVDALTAALDDLATRARTRLSEELGVRLRDIVAEIRFPAGGRPSVRIRPSARAGSEAPEAAGTSDLEAIVRRLLLGRDAR